MEKPILFNGAMVRAILEGRKTVTRRPVDMRYIRYIGGSGDDNDDPFVYGYEDVDGAWHVLDQTAPPFHFGGGIYGESFRINSPYGDPGDTLWVRETWQAYTVTGEDGLGDIECHPCEKIPSEKGAWRIAYLADMTTDLGEVWRPSIHMPRWASRIDLRVTSVTVERLHEVTVEEARKEGFDSLDDFKEAWDKTYKKRGMGWETDPWVWRIAFERIIGK